MSDPDTQTLREILERQGPSFVVGVAAGYAREQQTRRDPAARDDAERAHYIGWRADADTLEDARRRLRH